MSAPRLEPFAIALGVVLAFLLLLLRAASDGLLEMGDGVNHYMIARYSWKHPLLLLDLWGKPLFTLLASPFAQLGHVGVGAFNAVVAGATACAGTYALRRAGGVAQITFSLLVLLAPQYVLMVMAGMTEPLFGLVTVVVVMLLLNERCAAAAAIASLSPFARPEYIAFLPCVMLWLVLQRRWRALPWGLFGFAAYALLSVISKGDPLWFWTGDPYVQADGTYGSGPLDFFLVRAETVYGRPLLTLTVSALVLWPLVYWGDREHRRSHRLMLLCAALPALGIVAIHSILWYKGWRGSAGLPRVLVTGIPLTGLFAAFTLGRGALLLLTSGKVARLAGWLLLPAVCFWTIDDLTKQVRLPVRREMNQRFLDAAAFGVKHHQHDGIRVYSTHPYMAFRAELDPFDNERYNPLWGLTDEDVQNRFRTGDLLVWDSQLGSNEAGIPLDLLLNDGRFAVLELYEPSEGSRVFGGHVYEIFLLERRDVVRSFTVDTLIWNGQVREIPGARADTLPCAQVATGRWCLDGGEFPLELRALPLPDDGSIYDELIVTGNAIVEDGARLTLVFTQRYNGEGLRYDPEQIHNGPLNFSRRVPRAAIGTEQELYFWNLGGKPFILEGFTVLRKRWTQRPA